jgi:hypothetical protein
VEEEETDGIETAEETIEGMIEEAVGGEITGINFNK